MKFNQLLDQCVKSSPLDLQTVDLRTELKLGNFSLFSQAAQDLVRAALKEKKCVLIFSSRRGFGLILCRNCGKIVQCPQCNASLTLHTEIHQILRCHHCGYEKIPPRLCPHCGSYKIKPYLAGSQRLVYELKKLFPAASILRLDSDQKKTQSIFHHWLNSTSLLVATRLIFTFIDQLVLYPHGDIYTIIPSGDILNYFPDYKLHERVVQDYFRLNRLSAKLIIQSIYGKESIFSILNSRGIKKFLQKEYTLRRAFCYPPFCQLVKLTYRHKKSDIALKQAIKVFQMLEQNIPHIFGINQIQIFGPNPAFLFKERGLYRYQIVLKFPLQTLDQKYHPEFIKKQGHLLNFLPIGWEIAVDPRDLL